MPNNPPHKTSDTAGVFDADGKLVDNIIVDDFDSIKGRLQREIKGHRSDLAIAALQSLLDDTRDWQFVERFKVVINGK